jgi:hypothetical protein
MFAGRPQIGSGANIGKQIQKIFVQNIPKYIPKCSTLNFLMVHLNPLFPA